MKHVPSGLFVRCTEQRSQIQKPCASSANSSGAKLLEREVAAQQSAITAERREMVGSGERSEKIRTYNYPQNRITDHRIGLTLHSLDRVMDGDMESLFQRIAEPSSGGAIAAAGRECCVMQMPAPPDRVGPRTG